MERVNLLLCGLCYVLSSEAQTKYRVCTVPVYGKCMSGLASLFWWWLGQVQVKINPIDLKVSFAEGEIVSKRLKICLLMHSFSQFSAFGGKIVIVFLTFKFRVEVGAGYL